MTKRGQDGRRARAELERWEHFPDWVSFGGSVYAKPPFPPRPASQADEPSYYSPSFSLFLLSATVQEGSPVSSPCSLFFARHAVSVEETTAFVHFSTVPVRSARRRVRLLLLQLAFHALIPLQPALFGPHSLRLLRSLVRFACQLGLLLNRSPTRPAVKHPLAFIGVRHARRCRPLEQRLQSTLKQGYDRCSPSFLFLQHFVLRFAPRRNRATLLRTGVRLVDRLGSRCERKHARVLYRRRKRIHLEPRLSRDLELPSSSSCTCLGRRRERDESFERDAEVCSGGGSIAVGSDRKSRT